MAYLVKNCPQVCIPVSKKANIDTVCADGDPSKLTAYLLDCLFKGEEQAKMTCDGKIAGTTKLPDDVASILMGRGSFPFLLHTFCTREFLWFNLNINFVCFFCSLYQ